MKLEVLLSCMHQVDAALVHSSQLTGDVVVINQCVSEGYREYPTDFGTARMFFTTQRGLTRSRNMAIEKSCADVCMLCDDDEVFVSDYEQKILSAYDSLPQADVIIFKMQNRPASFSDQIKRFSIIIDSDLLTWVWAVFVYRPGPI